MRDKNVFPDFGSRIGRLVVLLLFVFASKPAQADDFKTHYDLALALYQAQKFEEAIPEFKTAYELVAKPGLLFNLAQAYRKAGHPREAIEYYDRYLSATPQLDGDTRRKVDGYLAEARNTLAALELEMKRRLAEDKAAHEQEPEAPPPLPTPSVVPAQKTPPTDQLVVAPATAHAEPISPSRPVYQRWWFWTAIGGAVAAGVIIGVAVNAQSAPPPITVAAGVPRVAISF